MKNRKKFGTWENQSDDCSILTYNATILFSFKVNNNIIINKVIISLHLGIFLGVNTGIR